MGADARVIEQVRIWRDDLLSLTRASNLLYFKHLKVGSLEITSPDPEIIHARFGQARFPGWLFQAPASGAEGDQASASITEVLVAPAESDAAPGARGGVLKAAGALSTTKATARDLASSLRVLHRSSTQEFLDKGIWILYLGLGILEWVDPEDDKRAASPILLVPVELVRSSPREPYRLALAEGDPVLNPALALKLEGDFGITLPDLDADDELGLVLSRVAKAVEGHPDWSVRPRTVLARFSFQKEVMYQDLRQNEQAIADHPIVAGLAAPTDGDRIGHFSFDPVPEDRLDEDAPAEDHPTVLDADATQRQCVEAAVRGATFVMDGPPGTGKSQTITNIIAELLRLGRRVLFVSEKAAALDVVSQRLTEAGLEDFLLPLHDQRTTRRDVAVSLARSLRQRPTIRSSTSSTELETLRARRRELSAYAAAMNEVRRPLDRSLHDAIGRQAALRDAPQAPVARAVGERASEADLTAVLEQARRLANSWGPVERGDAFLWRDLTLTDDGAGTRHALASALDVAIARLERLRSIAGEQAAVLLLDAPSSNGEVTRLLELLALVENRRTVPVAWLTEDLGAVSRRLDEVKALVEPHEALLASLVERVGEGWSRVDQERLADASQAASSLHENPIPEATLAGASAADLSAAEGLCAELRGLAPALAQVGTRVAQRFGLPEDRLTLARCSQLAQLGRLGESPRKPLLEWLDPGLAGALSEARTVLAQATEVVRARRSELSALYEDGILDLDLDGLAVRFATTHSGLGKLRAAYRQDKATLLPHLRARRLTPEAVANLERARTWQAEARALSRAERTHQPVLGDYYDGLDTDFAAIDQAIGVAQRALALMGRELERGRVHDTLLHPDGALVADVRELDELVARCRTAAEPLPPALAAAFANLPLDDLERVTSAAIPHLARLRAGLEMLVRVDPGCSTVHDLLEVAALSRRLAELRAAVDGRLPADQAVLGEGYQGVETRWEALDDGLGWAGAVRGLIAPPLSAGQADALLTHSGERASLAEALDAWRQACGTVLGHFQTQRRAMLSARLTSGFDSTTVLLDQLKGTLDDVAEWFAYARARAALEAHGLEAQVAFCEQQRLPGASLPDVIERSVLEGFVDATVAGDSRLATRRVADRAALVEEFRTLDRRLFQLASARVVRACSDRRPQTTIGPAAVILREAEKQRRHMPIRDLLAQTADVAQALKPCFLMSPLTVSQFLSPSMTFDAVIFDEASQVRPCDAINAIYRGAQLIVAGDQRQLPPTSFFARVDTDDTDEYEEGQFEEFPSVLDLCKGQGSFASLRLGWHYRSRHESLITFSNYSFYDGNLITFPSAAPDGDDAGVALFKVDGVYRRGGARDNPIEAEAVVDRVVEHARRHPSLSLGVVAFSEAQAAAIEVALDRRRKDLPELDDYFGESRLHGFFVKNLESVQGDERDIIVFSVGYGPDEVGKFTLNFGPLNRDGGERRLNVAVTRARQRVEIVSSVSAGDFVGDSAKAGVRHLRRYLDFADRGIAALGLEIGAEGHDTESPFEEEVARVLRSWGYDVVPQVGQSGYRIDLGIRDPRARGGYLLGVECDGFAYHSSKVARDRDRLRHEQLVNQGWTIHHIWGTAWYHERDRAEQQLRAALDAALATGGLRATGSPAGHEHHSVTVELTPVDEAAEPSWTVPYETATLAIRTQGLEMHAPEARRILLDAIEAVIATEGPVHEDVLIRRVREAWGVGRAGGRIKSAFDALFRHLFAAEKIDRDQARFLRVRGQRLEQVRVPVDGRPETERIAEHVALTEIALAVRCVVEEARVIDQDELTRYVARIFGWRRTGDGIVARIGDAVERAVSNGQVERDGDRLRLGAGT